MDSRFGFIKSPEDARDWKYSAVIDTTTIDVPDEILEDRLPIFDQLNEGICGGFAGMYHKGFQERQQRGRFVRVSERFIYKKSRELAGLTDPKQEGTTPRAVMQCLQKFGSCLSSTLPYHPYEDVIITDAMMKEALDYRIRNYAAITNVDDIIHARALGKTTIAGVLVTDSFMHCEPGGFVDTPQGAFYGGHLIEIDGYSKTMTHTYKSGKTRTGFVRIPNSWGPGVADEGYFYIPFDCINFVFDFGAPFMVEAWTSIDLDSDPVAPQPKSLSQSGTKIELYIDNQKAYVNSHEIILEAAPKIENNITLVPIRFVSENLGCSVSWDNNLRKVTITK